MASGRRRIIKCGQKVGKTNAGLADGLAIGVQINNQSPEPRKTKVSYGVK